jgi:hypothetical protein
LLFSGIALVAIWLLAMVGFTIAKRSKMTAEKVRAYAETLDLSKLNAADRAKAIQRLAEMLNALPMEERQRARMERLTWRWMDEMTEDEKALFIESTMPTGFKQMLSAFEQLPEEKRRRAIDDALRRLKEPQDKANAAAGGNAGGTNGPPILSKELEAKVRSIGLKTFYSESSAQTKAELAPVLEELQRSMENGRALRGR